MNLIKTAQTTLRGQHGTGRIDVKTELKWKKMLMTTAHLQETPADDLLQLKPFSMVLVSPLQSINTKLRHAASYYHIHITALD